MSKNIRRGRQRSGGSSKEEGGSKVVPKPMGRVLFRQPVGNLTVSQCHCKSKIQFQAEADSWLHRLDITKSTDEKKTSTSNKGWIISCLKEIPYDSIPSGRADKPFEGLSLRWPLSAVWRPQALGCTQGRLNHDKGWSCLALSGVLLRNIQMKT